MFIKQINKNIHIFRAFITNLLTYGFDVKSSSLLNQGWHLDTQSNMDSTSLNNGLKTRCGWFRKDFSMNNEWRQEGKHEFDKTWGRVSVK